MKSHKLVWVPFNGSFVLGTVLKYKHGMVNVRTIDNFVLNLCVSSIFPVNPSKFDFAKDLSLLSHLNEPCILHNLRMRYDHDLIYTNSGLFLLALNPYKKLCNLYDSSVVASYFDRTSNDPHIFKTARDAYFQVCSTSTDQTILITGESGAGKTENTKLVISFLASIAIKDLLLFDDISLKILRMNVVLEAFGNAKTVRNDNSSRFGKFVRILFKSSSIVGASVDCFLLEKSRVTRVSESERNYHIFYYLLGAIERVNSETKFRDSKKTGVSFLESIHPSSHQTKNKESSDAASFNKSENKVSCGKDSYEKVTGTEVSFGKDSYEKVSSGKDSHEKVTDTKVSYTKNSPNKSSHGKDSYSNATDTKVSFDIASNTQVTYNKNNYFRDSETDGNSFKEIENMESPKNSSSSEDDDFINFVRTLRDECSFEEGDSFNYLNNSCYKPSESDFNSFREVTSAFDVLEFPRSLQISIYKSLATVLFIGNIVIEEENDQAYVVSLGVVEKVCLLLNVPMDSFLKLLLRPSFKAGNEVVSQGRSKAQVLEILEALARSLYEKVFLAIIAQINFVLKGGVYDCFIGVLDIAGFEIFLNNDFEQLCINHTNERLQQFFNHHMFVLEQEAYFRENLQWEYIDFAQDLQPTIDLIESSNPIGVLSYLDEECVMPGGSDRTFLEKLRELEVPSGHARGSLYTFQGRDSGSFFSEKQKERSLDLQKRYIRHCNVNGDESMPKSYRPNSRQETLNQKSERHTPSDELLKNSHRFSQNKSGINSHKFSDKKSGIESNKFIDDGYGIESKTYSDNNTGINGNKFNDNGINNQGYKSSPGGNNDDGRAFNSGGKGIQSYKSSLGGNNDLRNAPGRIENGSESTQSPCIFRVSKLSQSFFIKHYAGEVEYSVSDWLKKNKDPYFDYIASLIRQSTDSFTQKLFMSNHTGKRGFFRTAAQKHLDSLNLLMKTLKNTSPFFVRCILPNNKKRPGTFDPPLVLEQLKCNGVMEGIRISRQGFPNKMTFKEFKRRYAVLGDVKSLENKEACRSILRGIYPIIQKKYYERHGFKKDSSKNNHDKIPNPKSEDSRVDDSKVDAVKGEDLKVRLLLNNDNLKGEDSKVRLLLDNDNLKGGPLHLNNRENGLLSLNHPQDGLLNDDALKSNETSKGERAEDDFLSNSGHGQSLLLFGNTMIFFRQGILADIEELRDTVLSVISHQMASKIKQILTKHKKERAKIIEKAARVIQKNARQSIAFKEWKWWKLLLKIKPLIEVNKLDENLKKKESKLEEMTRIIEEMKTKNHQKESEIESNKKETEELKMNITKKEETIKELRFEINNQKEDNKQKDKAIQEVEKKISEIELMNKSKDDIILEKDKKIQEVEKKILEIGAMSRLKDEIILEKDKKIQEREKQIQEVETMIQERDKRIVEIEAMSKSKDQIILEKDKQIQKVEKLFEGVKDANILKEEAIKKLENAIKQNEDIIKQMKGDHEDTLHKLKSEHEDTLHILKSYHENQMNNLKSEHEDTLHKLKSEHEDTLSNLKSEHENQMNILKSEHEHSLNNLEKNYAEELRTKTERMKYEIDMKEKSHNLKIDQIILEHQNEITETKNKINSLKTTIRTLKEKIQSEKALREDMENKHTKKINDLKNENKINYNDYKENTERLHKEIEDIKTKYHGSILEIQDKYKKNVEALQKENEDMIIKHNRNILEIQEKTKKAIERLEKENEDLKLKLNQNILEMQERGKKNVEALQKENEDIKTKYIKELTEVQERGKRDLQAFKKEMEDLKFIHSGEISAHLESIKNLEEQIQAFSESIKSLEAKNKNMLNHIESINEELKNTREDSLLAKTENKEIYSLNQKLTSENTQLLEARIALEKQLNENNANHSKLIKEHNSLEKQLMNITNEKDLQKQEITNNKATIRSLQREIENLQKETIQLQFNDEQNKTKIKTLQKELQKTHNENYTKTKLENEIKKLEGNSIALKKTIITLKNNEQNIKTKLMKIEQENHKNNLKYKHLLRIKQETENIGKISNENYKKYIINLQESIRNYREELLSINKIQEKEIQENTKIKEELLNINKSQEKEIQENIRIKEELLNINKRQEKEIAELKNINNEATRMKEELMNLSKRQEKEIAELKNINNEATRMKEELYALQAKYNISELKVKQLKRELKDEKIINKALQQTH